MTGKPLEGRSVWCSGNKESKYSGWIHVRETCGGERLTLIVTPDNGLESRCTMTREQAKTFAAQMMNLAVRNRT